MGSERYRKNYVYSVLHDTATEYLSEDQNGMEEMGFTFDWI